MANIGYEKLTVTGSAGFASVPAGATRAYIQCEDAAVRFRLDGGTTAPTTAEGTLIAVNGSITLKGEDVLNSVRFISAGTASLKVAYGTAGAGVESSQDAI